ncbi:hypothetical protein C1H46_033876 [Malus baccata]|uniref:Uncharacterized protein n=1 Tax=Malus baccata TaxID=106549 RepID=A0A540L2U3_MALBA|nr:hypothetical protein C1H46_033876 [Malus baccata]
MEETHKSIEEWRHQFERLREIFEIHSPSCWYLPSKYHNPQNLVIYVSRRDYNRSRRMVNTRSQILTFDFIGGCSPGFDRHHFEVRVREGGRGRDEGGRRN